MSEERPDTSRGIFDALGASSSKPHTTPQAGIFDLLGLPEAERSLVTWMMREGQVSLAQVGEHLGLNLDDAHQQLVGLETRGYVERVGTSDPAIYRTQRLAKRSSRLSTDLWRALDDTPKS
jgi:predicted Rossmann fold nucleotide-binding protein DprA/Smf involved in DNA uptake